MSTLTRERRVKEYIQALWVNLFRASQDAVAAGVTETEKAEQMRLRNEDKDLNLDQAFPLLRLFNADPKQGH